LCFKLSFVPGQVSVDLLILSSRMAASSSSAEWIKIVMCGDSGVGKTNLMARYTRNTFMEDSMSTIGAEFATRTVAFEGKVESVDQPIKKQMRLQIWDTAGQERYRAITRSYYRDTVGCMLVYSVTSKKSFSQLVKWIEEIRQNANRDPVIALIGNKSDIDASKHKVTLAMAQELVAEKGLAFCMETSAKTSENVEKAFYELLEQIIRRHPTLAQTAVEKSPVVLSNNAAKKKGCC